MSEEIDRRVKYIKSHPALWKKKHDAFTDAQFQKHKEFLARLKAQPGGKERIVRTYDI